MEADTPAKQAIDAVARRMDIPNDVMDRCTATVIEALFGQPNLAMALRVTFVILFDATIQEKIEDTVLVAIRACVNRALDRLRETDPQFWLCYTAGNWCLRLADQWHAVELASNLNYIEDAMDAETTPEANLRLFLEELEMPKVVSPEAAKLRDELRHRFGVISHTPARPALDALAMTDDGCLFRDGDTVVKVFSDLQMFLNQTAVSTAIRGIRHLHPVVKQVVVPHLCRSPADTLPYQARTGSVVCTHAFYTKGPVVKQRNVGLPVTTACRGYANEALAHVTAALHALNSEGIVHGAVSPATVLVDKAARLFRLTEFRHAPGGVVADVIADFQRGIVPPFLPWQMHLLYARQLRLGVNSVWRGIVSAQCRAMQVECREERWQEQVDVFVARVGTRAPMDVMGEYAARMDLYAAACMAVWLQGAGAVRENLLDVVMSWRPPSYTDILFCITPAGVVPGVPHALPGSFQAPAIGKHVTSIAFTEKDGGTGRVLHIFADMERGKYKRALHALEELAGLDGVSQLCHVYKDGVYVRQASWAWGFPVLETAWPGVCTTAYAGLTGHLDAEVLSATHTRFLEALQAMHGVGIYHCAIGPDTVYVDDGNQRFVLDDFEWCCRATDMNVGSSPQTPWMPWQLRLVRALMARSRHDRRLPEITPVHKSSARGYLGRQLVQVLNNYRPVTLGEDVQNAVDAFCDRLSAALFSAADCATVIAKYADVYGAVLQIAWLVARRCVNGAEIAYAYIRKTVLRRRLWSAQSLLQSGNVLLQQHGTYSMPAMDAAPGWP